MKKFNTEGICNPQKHYMVDITERLAQIKDMIDAGKYFTINRARQYGKTTTITALKNYIADDYDVISLDFQKIGSGGFSSEESFVQTFCELLLNRKKPVWIFRLKLTTVSLKCPHIQIIKQGSTSSSTFSAIETTTALP